MCVCYVYHVIMPVFYLYLLLKIEFDAIKVHGKGEKEGRFPTSLIKLINLNNGAWMMHYSV